MVYRLVYNVYCTVYNVYCTVYNVYCTVYNVYCTVYNVYCTVYNVYCTVYNVYCTVYNVYCTVYNVYCTVYNVYCRLLSELTTDKTLFLKMKASKCLYFIVFFTVYILLYSFHLFWRPSSCFTCVLIKSDKCVDSCFPVSVVYAAFSKLFVRTL